MGAKLDVDGLAQRRQRRRRPRRRRSRAGAARGSRSAPRAAAVLAQLVRGQQRQLVQRQRPLDGDGSANAMLDAGAQRAVDDRAQAVRPARRPNVSAPASGSTRRAPSRSPARRSAAPTAVREDDPLAAVDGDERVEHELAPCSRVICGQSSVCAAPRSNGSATDIARRRELAAGVSSVIATRGPASTRSASSSSSAAMPPPAMRTCAGRPRSARAAAPVASDVR